MTNAGLAWSSLAYQRLALFEGGGTGCRIPPAMPATAPPLLQLVVLPLAAVADTYVAVAVAVAVAPLLMPR